MRKLFLIFLSLFLAPVQGFAHEIAGTGFAAGLTHPVLGVDHLLAMVSVGILSAQMGGRAIWTVPATFVSLMVVGSVFGITNIPIPVVEYSISISVIALGIAIASAKKMPVVASMMFVGFFAIFHGHAHGTEMPYLAKPLFYALGFVMGTAGIHLVGVLIGYLATLKRQSASLLRYSGAAIAGMGLQILIG